MSSTVKDCSEYLQVLSKCNKVQRAGILKGADPKLIKAICKCALNVVKGNILLTPHHKRKLTPHKKTQVWLTRERHCRVRKRFSYKKVDFYRCYWAQ